MEQQHQEGSRALNSDIMHRKRLLTNPVTEHSEMCTLDPCLFAAVPSAGHHLPISRLPALLCPNPFHGPILQTLLKETDLGVGNFTARLFAPPVISGAKQPTWRARSLHPFPTNSPAHAAGGRGTGDNYDSHPQSPPQTC